MIVEAGKSHGQLSVSCSPRNIGMCFKGLRTRLRVGEDGCLTLSSQAESKFNLLPPFCSIQTLNGLGDVHPHRRGPSAILSSSVQMLISHTYPEVMIDQSPNILCCSEEDTKLTITTAYHSVSQTSVCMGVTGEMQVLSEGLGRT